MLRSSSLETAAAFSDMSDGPRKCRPVAAIPWHFAQFRWYTGLWISDASELGVCAETLIGNRKIAYMAIASRVGFNPFSLVFKARMLRLRLRMIVPD